MKKFIQSKLDDKQDPQEVLEELETINSDSLDEEILKEVEQFTLSPVLRRARRTAPILQGARILWVDDNPHHIIYESGLLRSLGITVDLAHSTSEGLSMLMQTKYDAVISDIEREGIEEEGLKFRVEMLNSGFSQRIIFYIAQVDLKKGTPPYVFGITNRTDDLLHFVMDILERERS